ncbi:MAG: transporter substrate-binding domain-containing protein [Alphaproteobacteria bacterium]|nr:transporter substrate-binding domain-containing protein [Alphaproteobacteria bacterium]
MVSLFRSLLLAMPVSGLLLDGAAEAQASNQKQLVEIATREFLPPYVEQRAGGGIEIDIVKAILRDSAYEPVFIQQPRVRMISAFESKVLDGILTQNIAASNEGCATDWYISHQNVAITVEDKDMQITGLPDLKGLSVLSFSGATRYLGQEFANAIKDTERYTESGDQGKHISLLYKNRFDVIVGDSWILSLAQKRFFTQTGQYKAIHKHPIMAPSLYVARFHDQAICDAFNLGLRSLRASGEYADIWDGYEKQLMIAIDGKSGARHETQ